MNIVITCCREMRQFLAGCLSSLLAVVMLVAAIPAWSATVTADSHATAKVVVLGQAPVPDAQPNSWTSGGEGGASSVAAATEKREKSAMVHLPAPAALWLFGSGLAALGFSRRRGIGLWRRRRSDGENRDDNGKIVRAKASSRKAKCRNGISGKPCGARLGEGRAIRPLSRVKEILISSGIRDKGMEHLFADIAKVFLERPSVAIGRGFGRECVKVGKKTFLALEPDHSGIAFRLGEDGARDACQRWSGLELWNPMAGRKPKHSWVICKTADGELLVYLAAEAFKNSVASGRLASAAIEDGKSPEEFASSTASGRLGLREPEQSERVAG